MDDEIQTEVARQAGAELAFLSSRYLQVCRVQENIAKLAVAANMAASRPAPGKNFVIVKGHEQWHKSVELMDHVWLCHRPMVEEAEFAVVRHSPATECNEICHRAWNAVEVLKAFVDEEHRERVLLAQTIMAKLKKIYLQKYSDLEAASLAEQTVQQFGLAPMGVPIQFNRHRL